MSSPAAVNPLPARLSAAALRRRLETDLAARIPAAFTLRDRVPDLAGSGVAAIDELTGGLPRGALSEIFGAASSGRTSVLLAAMAAATARGESCALVDVADSFDPASAAAAGVNLAQLLWVRCMPSVPNSRSADLPHGRDRAIASAATRARSRQFAAVRQIGNVAPAPRDIGIWGYGDAETMQRIRGGHNAPQRRGSAETWPIEDRPAQPQNRETRRTATQPAIRSVQSCSSASLRPRGEKNSAYGRLDRALRAADLLLSGGGFGLVALDLAGLPLPVARRVPLTSWFRFRRAVENTPAVLLLIGEQPVTQSCASLVLRLHRAMRGADDRAHSRPGCDGPAHARLLEGFDIQAEVLRSPCAGRKPPRNAQAEFVAVAEWAG